ncbi:MAG: nuclear transport factor 2 family protein [Proteobacteria bacterium]|jgi:hypothetical protein|nr:nuclear transport factor 2 family protein [Pseudomonadota bacterium]
MTESERLAAIEEIKQLKARYFRALDTKDMAAYASIFTDDAQIDVRGSVTSSESEDGSAIEGFDDGAIIVGGTAMAAFVTKVASEIVTAHHGHTPEIEILSETTARGIWAMEDRLWFPEGSPNRMMHGYGHYHETYAKVDGAWRIASMTITRLRVDLD